jgi:PAS domain S-box-containing protein
MDRGALKILDLEQFYPDPSALAGKNISSLLEYKLPRGYLREKILEEKHVRDLRYPFRTLSGKDRWALHDSYLVKDPVTGEKMVQVIIRDISEIKKSEEALRESEERFRAIFEGSLDAIFLADPESGEVIDANPAAEELLLRPREEIIGLHQTQLHPPRLKSSVEELFSKYGRGEDIELPVDGYVLRSDGRETPVEMLAQVIQIDGVPVFCGTFRDIAERKRMEEEATRVERLESLGILAGGIAHDFNNILTPIMTNISMAKAHGEFNGEIDEMLTDAEKATSRARGLTQQLLTFSRGGAPVKKPTSVSNLLRDTVKFALSGSNVRAEYSIREDLWQCEIDEGQIGQVIHNMVINADQAMPDGGTINLSLENVMIDQEDSLPLKDGRYVKISITDQGVGIPGKHLLKIFDPFYTTKEKGSGLGLSTSFAIVKGHDGTIQVESDLGVSTTFCVYLPASESEPGVGKTERKKPLRGKGRILVVDDDDAVRRSAEKVLKRLGYRVELAKDGAEGVGIYEKAMKGERPFDAVIMDLTIPGGMGGKEGVRELKRIDPDAKAIVSSGYSADPVMSEFSEYGFVGVARKPYNIEDLSEVLAKVITEERG